MAENAPQQQVQMRIDDSQAKATYANAFRHQSNPQEVILDFGLNIVMPRQNTEEPTQMSFKIDNRLVMNYPTAKRLVAMVDQLVKAHEQKFGEIKLDQQQV